MAGEVGAGVAAEAAVGVARYAYGCARWLAYAMQSYSMFYIVFYYRKRPNQSALAMTRHALRARV